MTELDLASKTLLDISKGAADSLAYDYNPFDKNLGSHKRPGRDPGRYNDFYGRMCGLIDPQTGKSYEQVEKTFKLFDDLLEKGDRTIFGKPELDLMLAFPALARERMSGDAETARVAASFEGAVTPYLKEALSRIYRPVKPAAPARSEGDIYDALQKAMKELAPTGAGINSDPGKRLFEMLNIGNYARYVGSKPDFKADINALRDIRDSRKRLLSEQVAPLLTLSERVEAAAKQDEHLEKLLQSDFLERYKTTVVPLLEELKALSFTKEEIALGDTLQTLFRTYGARLEDIQIRYGQGGRLNVEVVINRLVVTAKKFNRSSSWSKYDIDRCKLHDALVAAQSNIDPDISELMKVHATLANVGSWLDNSTPNYYNDKFGVTEAFNKSRDLFHVITDAINSIPAPARSVAARTP